MRLYLIRHPKPDVAPGVCYGSTDLCVSTAEEVKALEALVPVLPNRIQLYSSPLRRCLGLAQRLAHALDAGAPILDARLVEMHFGAWEGRMWDDIDRAEVDAWASDPVGCRPGGGETVREAALRVHGFLEAVRQRELSTAIVVCHAGTIRLLEACQGNVAPEQAAVVAAQAARAPGYGTVRILDL